MEFEVVIGLEVHAQLNTKQRYFAVVQQVLVMNLIQMFAKSA